MSSALPSAPLFAAFLLASLVLAITPGPGVFYIVTRSLSQGRRAGLASVAGVALGNFGNMIGAVLGLAAVFAVSAIAFKIVQYTGAAYLIYLGLRTLRATTATAPPLHTRAPLRIFRDGFIVALLNPKTAMFFAAFLPQFVGHPDAAITQTLMLGTLFVAIAATTDTVYALAASVIAPRLENSRRFARSGRYLTAGSFIALGLYTAFFGTRRATSA